MIILPHLCGREIKNGSTYKICNEFKPNHQLFNPQMNPF